MSFVISDKLIIDVLLMISIFKCSGLCLLWWNLLVCGIMFSKWWIVCVFLGISGVILLGIILSFCFVFKIDLVKWVVVLFVGVISFIVSGVLVYKDCNMVNSLVIVVVLLVFGLLVIILKFFVVVIV